ncbi:MAG: hypothetical protein V4596_05330 [Bdellovibrionota bacterium]
MIKNQSGAIALDFIFALVLVLSMTLLLGVFSFSLSIIESVQYLTFSSSRAYFAGHISQAEQKKAAEKKFKELSATGSYQKLLKKDWFNVTLDEVGDSRKEYDATDERDILEGVRTKIVVGLLELQIPLFGSTKGDNPYETFVTSFLGRESSTEECMEMVNRRFKEILNLGPYSAGTVNPTAYVSFDDNGC